MIYGPDDVKDLEGRVRPPNWSPKAGYNSFDDRISFTGAVELAVYFRDECDSPLLLQELRKLYPKEVAASVSAAEEHAGRSAQRR